MVLGLGSVAVAPAQRVGMRFGRGFCSIHKRGSSALLGVELGGEPCELVFERGVFAGEARVG